MSQRDTPKTTPSRISEEMLNELIGDDDATVLFHRGALFDDPKQRLAERILNAEMTHHLAQDDQRYPDVVRSWRSKWALVTPFLTFSEPIRKVLYTTNAIESLNAAVRRTVRSRGHFTSERAAFKLIYMTLREATAKWKGPLACWNAAQREFAIHFGERFEASRGYVTRT